MFWATKITVEARENRNPRVLKEISEEQARMTPKVRGTSEK